MIEKKSANADKITSDSVVKSYSKYDNKDVVADEPKKEVNVKSVTRVSTKTSKAPEIYSCTTHFIVLVLSMLTPRFTRCS